MAVIFCEDGVISITSFHLSLNETVKDFELREC
jgi:hypothetical protein